MPKRMTDEELQEIKDRWHKEVWDRSAKVDTGRRFNWEGVLLGFLLGAGMPLTQADEIAIEAPQNGWEI